MEAILGGVFRRARASLGVTSFGMQLLELPPNGGDSYLNHDHDHDSQEEVYVLLRPPSAKSRRVRMESGSWRSEPSRERHTPRQPSPISVGPSNPVLSLR